ncbi:MAG: DUF1269 domain-containing protein [Acidobacteriaceae bacterium]
MEKMLVVVFDTEKQAYQAKTALAQLELEGSITIYADAVISRNADGSTTVKQVNEQAPLGMLSGTAMGSLVGLLGGPVGLAIGASAGLLAGLIADMANSGVGEDFIDDVRKELTPGKFAIAADIEEVWTEPVDVRMEAIGGKVFRRSYSEVKQTLREQNVAAMKADLAELQAEHAVAQADRKSKLHQKINQLESKIQAHLQRNKEAREAAEREANLKAETRKAKAAEQQAAADSIHVHA